MKRVLCLFALCFVGAVIPSVLGHDSKLSIPFAPALITGLNAHGVTNLVNEILPPLLAKLANTHLPDQSGSKDTIDWSISNIVINSVTYAGFDVSVGSDVQVTLNGLSISGGLDWKYREKIWPHLPQGSGSADFSGTAGVISFSARVVAVANANGLLYPQVVIDSCNVDVSALSVKVHGSIFSWLYDIIIALFKNQLKSAADAAIKGTLVSAINVKLDQILAQVKYGVKFLKWGYLDYSITSDAFYIPTTGNLALPFKGEVYQQNSTAECPLPHYLSAYVPSGRMVDFVIDVFTFNSGAYHYYQENVWDYIVNNSTWPVKFPEFPPLFTRDWAFIFPSLQSVYPDMPMQLELHLGGAPTLSTNNGAASVVIPFSVDVEVVPQLPQPNTVEVAFTLEAIVTAVVNISTIEVGSQPAVLVQIDSPTSIFLTVVNSTIGKIDPSTINFIINGALELLIIPDINKGLAGGFPLPSIDGISLKQPFIGLNQNTVMVSADIQYSPPL